MATPMGQRAGCPVFADNRICLFRGFSKYKGAMKKKMMVSVNFYVCLVSHTWGTLGGLMHLRGLAQLMGHQQDDNVITNSLLGQCVR